MTFLPPANGVSVGGVASAGVENAARYPLQLQRHCTATARAARSGAARRRDASRSAWYVHSSVLVAIVN